MKYRFLLRILRVLIYVKRFFWWIGTRGYFLLAKIIGRIWKKYSYFRYKTIYFLKRIGIGGKGEWFLKRGFLQLVAFGILLFIAFPQTKLNAKRELGLPGQKTLVFSLAAPEEIEYYEEVLADSYKPQTNATWREGALSSNQISPGGAAGTLPGDMISIVAGGNAFSKPIILPGSVGVSTRNQVEEYTIQPGDSLISIASDFAVSVETILWENGLGTKSVIRPGQILKIPPVSGVTHVVKKSDSLQKIASLYKAKVEEIAKFNNLRNDGKDLKVGAKIMVPNGVKPTPQIATQTLPTKRPATISVLSRIAAPPPSVESAGASGFIWPTGARTITTYFKLGHPALDIAGPFHTPNYAAQAGTVEVANCPPVGEYRGAKLNHGYGCYVIINHGNGVKTLYGHNDQILVSVGDQVERRRK
jgi:murein DD-endopeptidase MepM/ murein hydrolase activator NlpD